MGMRGCWDIDASMAYKAVKAAACRELCCGPIFAESFASHAAVVAQDQRDTPCGSNPFQRLKIMPAAEMG